MKKIIITMVVLLIAMIVMVYLYFSNLNNSTRANDLSINTVSANAGVVFSFDHDKSFYEILSGQELFQYALGKTKSDQLKAIKKQLIEQEFTTFLEEQKIYIGFIPGPSNQVGYLICTQLKEAVNLNQFLSRYLPKRIKTTQLKDVVKLTFSDSVAVYLGIKDNLLVLSDESDQVQKIMSNDLAKTSDFANYIKANTGITKNSLANLYLNFNALPSILKNILNSSLNGELDIFNQHDTYATLNYNFSSEKLLFNGTTKLGNGNSYYKLFDKLTDQKLTINNLLPKTTANYTIYAISDYQNWLESLSKWLIEQKGNERVLKNEELIAKKYGLDLKKIFPNYFKNQFVTFQLASGEKFGGISLSNGEKVGQLLLELSAEYAPDIKIFREAGIPYRYFGAPFKKFEKPFYTIIDNYLVMANHASSIQFFLNSYRTNALLINDENYQRFNDQLSAATLSFYINNKNSNTIFGRNLKAPYYKHYQSKNGLREFDAFSYQLSGDKGKFLSNVLLAKKQEKVTIDSLKN
ncbi:hypothetical protein WG904_13580 [Pedobacter sp. Du54]|uniref:hypothetical protein n=1 Tax=Pedobacter anseongensis TaxID=3133439 RepID=UPI0030B66824